MTALRLFRRAIVATALLVSISAPAQRRLTPYPTDLTHPIALPGTWEFDVASIHPSLNRDRRQRLQRHPESTYFSAQNASLSALLQFAYGVTETRILGIPDTLANARFDLLAKGDAPTDERFRQLPPAQQLAAKQRMMQSMLADRCHLVVHTETRVLPVFALVVARGGPRLPPSDEKYTIGWGGWRRIEIEGGDTLARFVEELSRVSGRPVLNRTGLTGSYNIEIEWADEDDDADDSDVPQLFAALPAQLGLKLETRRAPVEVVVIDHIELPSEN